MRRALRLGLRLGLLALLFELISPAGVVAEWSKFPAIPGKGLPQRSQGSGTR